METDISTLSKIKKESIQTKIFKKIEYSNLINIT